MTGVPTFNIFDWYWSVLDTSPGTQVWSSASGSYVALANATYVAWLAAGNVTTVIDTEANLHRTINNFNVSNWNQNATNFSSVALTSGTPLQLTNVLSRVYQVAPGTADNAQLFFPQANVPGAPPLGQTILFKGDNSNVHVWDLKPYTGAGSVFSNIGSTQAIMVWLTDNTTQGGTWDAIMFPPLDAVSNAYFGGMLLTGSSTANKTKKWLPVTMTGDGTFSSAGALAVTGIGNITSGLLPLANGGTHANLSATGGASKFLRQNSSGADVDVVQPALADLSDFATGSWTPTDASGAALTFTAAQGTYIKIGKLIIAWGYIGYPATADGSNSLIGGLPFTVRNTTEASQGFVGATTVATLSRFSPTANTTTAIFYTSTLGRLTNLQMSGSSNLVTALYPTT